MIDPDSTKFEWPYDFTAGALKGLFSKRHTGWITCGLVNSRNRMGGYSGQSYFEVVIHNGLIDMLDIGEAQDFDMVNMSCQKLIKDGFLRSATVSQPPVSAMPTMPAMSQEQILATAQNNAKAAAASGGIGVTFMSSPVGATIVAVAPGSRADKAGLKAGETLEAINGIPIKGMSQASIIAILHSDAPSLVMKVVGVGDITIRR